MPEGGLRVPSMMSPRARDLTGSRWLLAAALIVGTISAFQGVHAQSADVFKGKQIRIIVGTSAGGGYDAYARLLAAHLPDHLPGRPSIVVQNMPGAGSLNLLNYLTNVAPQDGTAVGAVHSLGATHPLFFPDQVQYDARKLQWIGSALRETFIGVVRASSPVKSLDEALMREATIASATGATRSYPTFVNQVVGAKFKIVQGYPGTKEGLLAMERGEADGVIGTTYASLKSTAPVWLNPDRGRIFIQFGLRKRADLPEASWIFDYARTGEDRAAMDLMFGSQEFGRPFVLPPGVPSTTVQLWRDAFDATMADPAFLADAEKRRLDIDETRGVDIGAMVDHIYATPPAVLARVKAVVGSEIE